MLALALTTLGTLLMGPAPEGADVPEPSAGVAAEAPEGTETAVEAPAAPTEEGTAAQAPVPPTEPSPAPTSVTTEASAASTAGAASVEEPPAAPAAAVEAPVAPEERRGGAGVSAHNTRITTIGGPEVSNDGWRMDFHGFVSAPLRFGMGRRPDPQVGQARTTFHAPIIPDDQYLGWQHTAHAKRSWAELYLGYGNDVAKAVVALQAWNFSDVSYGNPNAQLGVGQAFVSITPKLRRSPVQLRVKIGGHDNRYGMAGKHDQGAYETYIFGRTRYLGESIGVDIPFRDFRFTVDHGFGGTPLDPNIFNSARFTLTAHHHVGMAWKDKVDFGLHHIVAFAQSEAHDESLDPDLPDGNVQIFGPDLRLDFGRGGYWYLGYSYANLKTARVVGPSVEVLHSFGGGYYDLGLIGNYFDYRRDAEGYLIRDSEGTGSIQTIMFQTNHSLHEIIAGEDGFWGEGWDVKLALYGMMNFVNSDVDATNGVRKMKFGADLMAEVLPYMGIGAKFDQVMPNNQVRQQTWSVLSPRLEFRTDWIAHETITIQYSRYIYAERDCGAVADPLQCVQPPSASIQGEGYGALGSTEDSYRGAPLAPPDENVFAIMASIYW